jgi:ppGpp synthetase/RelA/SpoT-type nucleotidyltranferase
MGWTKPKYTRGEVNAAGRVLVAEFHKDQPLESFLQIVEEQQRALKIINNWRSSHSYPLHCIKMTLKSRTKLINKKTIVAQRIKRLPSIETKLKRWQGMDLARMHDIGGCRAIMRNVQEVQKLVSLYETSRSKNPRRGAEFVKIYDYIANPKSDGYRGIHLVYKYRSTSPKKKSYSGLRIEIQVRTNLQHAWATAVETVSIFTGQALKSNVGDDRWKRFFALAGTALAEREKRPPVPGTPTESVSLIKELRELYYVLQVETVLTRWGIAARQLGGAKGAHTYLLVLDAVAKTVQVTGFQEDELARACVARFQISFWIQLPSLGL